MSRIRKNLRLIDAEQKKIEAASKEPVSRERARLSQTAANRIRDAVAATEASADDLRATMTTAIADGKVTAQELDDIRRHLDALNAALRGE